MEMQAVKSTMIAAMGYDAEEGILVVRFNGNDEDYVHTDVAPEVYEEMKASSSIGKYYNTHIKSRYKSAQDAAKPKPGPVEVLPPKKPIKPAAVPSFTTQEEAVSTAMVVAQQLALVKIETPGQRGQAAENLVIVARARKQRVEFFAPMKETAYKAHRAVCDAESKAIQPLDELRASLEGSMRVYDAEADRQRRAEEERLRKIEQERAEADAARLTEEMALEDAGILAAQGRHEEADAVLAAPIQVPARPVAAVILPTAIPQTRGVSGRKVPKFKIERPELIPREFLMVDESKIRRHVNNLGLDAKIPGVAVWLEDAYAVNTKRA